MKKKLTDILFFVKIVVITTVFVFLLQIAFSQTYVPITNYHNGISLGIQGTQGNDYIFDRYYHDPIINDCGLCYIKSDVAIELFHNSNNSRAAKDNVTDIIGGDFGEIRIKIDRDWQKLYWAGNDGLYGDGRAVYPSYPGPFSFDDMQFEAGVPVVGSIGFNPGVPLTDRDNSYSRGMLDEAGNEYHYLTYADDDDAEPNWKNIEMSASDSKSMLFCVNPKTPAIWLSTTTTGAQYYTTPAKVWWVPKIHEQISYMTDDVDIQLKNIMNSSTVYYRIDGGSYQAYTGAISSNALSDGSHILEFYYDPAYVQTRQIVKNPDHPCKQDIFEDGKGHGYLLWRDEADFLRFKDRALNGSMYGEYNYIKTQKLPAGLGWTGNGGIRNQRRVVREEDAAMYATVGVLEGVANNIQYMEAAKIRLLHNRRMHIEGVGVFDSHNNDAVASKELNYRGYRDDVNQYQIGFGYDLIAKYYRSDQFAGGITPIEDLRIRDMLASTVLEAMCTFGGYGKATPNHSVDATPSNGMWTTARQNGALIAALAMPAYNTHYFGTSGFDGTQATHDYTPFPDYPESWKDVFLTYTDKDNPAHMAQLHPFPNRRAMFNFYDGTMEAGMIYADGSWGDRLGYSAVGNMGHGIEIFYNVMKRKFNKDCPKIDLFIQHSVNGTLTGHKFSDADDYLPTAYGRRMMGNEYFPSLAGQALNFEVDGEKYSTWSRPYFLFFNNPDWASVTLCESAEPPTVPSNLLGTPAETTISLSWSASTHTECGVSGYKIYRDGSEIATIQGTSFTDGGLAQNVQYQYEVASVSEAGVVSAKCTPIYLTTLADVIAPTIVSVPNANTTTIVSVEYSEAMDVTTAETLSNYSIDNGVSVSAAQLQADNITVELTVSTLSSDIVYTLTINNVEDLNGNAIAANSSASFIYVDPSTVVNLALNKPAYSSSVRNGKVPENAVDGDVSTNWQSLVQSPEWIYVDLEQNYDINRILIDWDVAFSTSYELQISDDATNWNTIYSDPNADGGVDDIIGLSANCRYIRLYCLDLATVWGHTIHELEVYGGSSAPVAVTGVSVNPVSISINNGQTTNLTETVAPANASNKSVSWSSSNTNVATVDASGVVTGIAEGNAIITVTTNDGGFTATCDVTVTTVLLTEYYCDPVNGSMSNDGSESTPWSTLEDVINAGKTFNAGDKINLYSGYHGAITIDGQNSGHVTIRAVYGNQPSLKNILFENASNWIIRDLTISTGEAPGAYERVDKLVEISGSSNNIIIERCNVYSLEDCSAWTEADWVALSCMGISIDADDNIVRNCIVRNVDHAVSVNKHAENTLIESNEIYEFSGDGMRGVGSYNTFQYNYVHDNLNVDGNHDDGFQSFSVDEDWNVGTTTVYGNILRGNTIIQSTDPNRPFQGDLQGIGNFDGMFEDWIIENNVVVCSAYHGISFLGAVNCKITNNTVINPEGELTWIQITAHKDGTPSTGNSIRNNLARDVRYDDGSCIVENNIEISLTEYNSYFIDVANFDLHLRQDCPAIDAGTSTTAPAMDIEGVIRPNGGGFDVGAYEFFSTAAIPVSGVTVSPISLALNIGQSSNLIKTVSPANATDQSVTWSSNNTAVATVDANGVVSALSAGQATITVTTTDGGFTATCDVTVNAVTPGENLALNKPAYSSSVRLGKVPENAVDGDVSTNWQSLVQDPEWIYVDLLQNYNIDRVLINWDVAYSNAYEIQISDDASNWSTIYSDPNADGGIDDITGLATNGRYVRIYCTAHATQWGHTIHELEVYGAPSIISVTGVNITPTTLTLDEGQTSDLTEAITPVDATDQSVSWSTSNSSIATVDANGVVSALSAGQAIITVTTNDGGYTATCDVTVNVPVISVTDVSLAPATLTLDEGASSGLTETVSPVNATDQSVTWSSNNTAVATVDANGVVSALSDGQAIITVTTNDGGFTATCNVTVNAVTPGENLALNKPAYSSSVRLGKVPENAVDGDVSTNWQSLVQDPEWIYVDLLQNFNIDRVLINWDVAYSNAYEIQISDDASNWTTVYSDSNADGGIDDITGLATNGRYVRIYCTAHATQWGHTIHELEVYGAPSIISVTGVNITPTTLTLDEGQTSDLTEAITPVDATDQTVSWSTSNSSIATVDANGVVSALSGGLVTITATTTDGGFTATCNVTVNAVTPGENLALNKPAYSSSVRLGKVPENAVDGDLSTNWQSLVQDPEWIYVDLLQNYNIDRVLINWDVAYSNAYEIQVSDDASNWTTVYSDSNADGGIDDITGLATNGRYVRIYCTAHATYWGHTIHELEVYGNSLKSIQMITKDVPLRSDYSFEVFPTPSFDGYFMIRMNGFEQELNNREVNIQLMDLCGKVVYTINHTIVPGQQKRVISINYGPLRSGIYILKMKDGNNTLQKKMVIH